MWADFVVKRILGFRGEKLREYFDELELESVVPKLLQYAFDYQACENVVWILKEEFEQKLAKAEDEGHQNLYHHLKVQSVKPFNEKNLEAWLPKFLFTSLSPQQVTHESQIFQLYPIATPKGKVIAYLVLLNVVEEKAAKVLENLSKDLSYMNKHISFSYQHWQVQKQSFMDDLTSLFNQKYMGLVLDNEISRAQREEKKFSVLFMDVDFFKAVNDTRGHWVGSRLLVELGHQLKNLIRRSDYAFRYGGDEFVVILPSTEAEGARIAAERLRYTIEKTDFLIDGEKIKVTLSIGLATFPDHAKTHKDIIKMADEAMYCGKNKSRNVVFVAS